MLLCIAVAGAQGRAGWTPLFNGHDMDGWEMQWGKDWKAENGALVCDGTERSWLSTTQTFSDYTLKLEFRGAEKVNSGVFLRSEKEGQPHLTGYELQIWDYQPAGFNTGSLVGSLKAQPVKIILQRLEPLRNHRQRQPFHDCVERKDIAGWRGFKTRIRRDRFPVSAGQSDHVSKY